MKNILILLCSILLFACGTIPVGITTSTSPLAPGIRGTVPTSASDCQYNLFGLIPITTSLSTQYALDVAKSNIGVNVLTDVVVDYKFAHYLLFSNSCVRVSGLGVR